MVRRRPQRAQGPAALRPRAGDRRLRRQGMNRGGAERPRARRGEEVGVGRARRGARDRARGRAGDRRRRQRRGGHDHHHHVHVRAHDDDTLATATTTRPATVAPPTTPVALPIITDDPQTYAEYLFAAWQNANQTAAAEVASAEAVTQMFASRTRRGSLHVRELRPAAGPSTAPGTGRTAPPSR